MTVHALSQITRAPAPLPPGRLNAPPPAQASRTPAPVTFGLSGQQVTNTLIPVFQKINEQYVWGFLAVDALAFWMMRTVGGLIRGREKYDARQDPTNQNLSPFQLMRKSLQKNATGLNWGFAGEEMIRESLTAPLSFCIPASVMGVAAGRSFKSAVGLGYHPMTNLKNTWVHQLRQRSTPLSEEGMRDHLKQFVEELLTRGEPDLLSLKTSSGKPFSRVVKQWADDWSALVAEHLNDAALGLKSDREARKILDARLETLNGRLQTVLIEEFNRVHHLGDRLYRPEYLNVGVVENGQWTRLEQPIQQTLDQLIRFKDFMAAALPQQQRNPGIPLAELVEKSYRKLVGLKFGFGLLAASTVLMMLSVVPKISQHSKRYPANRLYYNQGGQPA
ncbi:MAG: hypothetical protein AB7P76_01185 [Candidatus Melainabacteria bacterium]